MRLLILILSLFFSFNALGSFPEGTTTERARKDAALLQHYESKVRELETMVTVQEDLVRQREIRAREILGQAYTITSYSDLSEWKKRIRQASSTVAGEVHHLLSLKKRLEDAKTIYAQGKARIQNSN